MNIRSEVLVFFFSTSGLPFFAIANGIDRDKRSGKTAKKFSLFQFLMPPRAIQT